MSTEKDNAIVFFDAAFPDDFDELYGNTFDYFKGLKLFYYQEGRAELEAPSVGGGYYLYYGSYVADPGSGIPAPSYHVVALNPKPDIPSVKPPYIVGLFEEVNGDTVLFGGVRNVRGNTPPGPAEGGGGQNLGPITDAGDESAELSFAIFDFGFLGAEPIEIENKVVLRFSGGEVSYFDIQKDGQTQIRGDFGEVGDPVSVHTSPGQVSVWQVDWTEANGDKWIFFIIHLDSTVVGIIVNDLRANPVPGSDPGVEQRVGVFAAENTQVPPDG